MEELKTFTLGEFADAIEKNGLPQTHFNFFRDEVGRALALDSPAPIAQACAVGMAAINLGVNVNNLRANLYVETGDLLPLGICRIIESWNDGDGLTFKQIADKFRSRYPTILDKEFAVLTQEYVTTQDG